MYFTPFQILISICAVLFFIFAIDSYQRKKFNALHFIVFFWGSALLLFFILSPKSLDSFWQFFWLARWADLIVYVSIIILLYLYFELMNVFHRSKIQFTNLNRELTIQSRDWNITNSKTVFIIPAYNESDNAIEVIREVIDNWYWVIFVDDWSQNYLFKKLKDKFLWINKDIVFLRHPVNMWQWAALETWFEYIRRYWEVIDYVVTFDSDWQHRLIDLQEFVNAFKKDSNLEIVLGSRFLWSAQNLPLIKKIVLKLWIIFTWVISWIKLSDTHNGYRMIKKDSLNKIKITMNGMEHASEIIDIIKVKKIKYKEVPITVIYTQYSIEHGTGKSSKAFKVVLNMIYKKFFFK